MAWRSCISAVVLIVVVAVAAFIRIFESNAQRLEYVNSCVNSSVNLMDYKFVWLGVGEALCRIGYYFGVVVGIDFIVCVREAYARIFAPANAETAVPEAEVLTATVAFPVVTATVAFPAAFPRAFLDAAPPPAFTEQAAVEPRQQEAANDVLESRPEYSAFRETLRLQDVANEVVIQEVRARCWREGAAHQQR